MSRLAGALLALGVVVAVAAGCADVRLAARRYRAEQALYAANKSEDQVRLGGQPDSTELLQLRATYAEVRAEAPLPGTRPRVASAAREYRDLYRTLATAELQGARLAMEAHRPDLVIQSVEWIENHAKGDTTAARQADLLMISAYRAVGRYDDAVAKIHDALRAYPPRSVANGIDAILTLPDEAVRIRTALGDTAAIAKEQAAAVSYFRGLLRQPHPGRLAAQIRSEYVRALLSVGNASGAIAEAQRLESQVRADSSLASLLPDVLYINAKVRAVTGKDRVAAASLLAAVASTYPASNVAGRALFESAALLEDAGRYVDARDRYREAASGYSKELDVAPLSLYREAMLEERLGNWPEARPILESIPLRYPNTKASAEAPLAIVRHYARLGDRAATDAALRRAIDTYRQLLGPNVTSAAAAVYRFDILQCQLASKDYERVYAAVDDLATNHPGNPLTAQALLVGAKVARGQNLKDRSAGYLQQYLEQFPGSPAVKRVREELRKLAP